MMNQFLALIIGIFFAASPVFSYAQIKVLESQKSDSTKYSTGTHQDSVYIVYKGDNNKSSITLTADYKGIDSLNFDWYGYNYNSKIFVLLQSTDSVMSDTLKYDDPTFDMNDYEGGYRVNIHNQQKGIDTTFTVWVWYQDFFINSIRPITSTCENLELLADTSFQSEFFYTDLSIAENPTLSISNEAKLEWTVDPNSESVKKTGARPRFIAPVEPTSYTLNAFDLFGFTRERTYNIDKTKIDSKGYPYLRAVKAEFSGVHGNNTASNDSVRVEAPYGVMFTDSSKNADEFEWIFYNHIDWISSEADSALAIINSFEPNDSIYYLHPPYDTINSPIGYDVKLSVWGPVYNDNSDRCMISIRKPEFVVVTPTYFPDDYKLELPNVFTPGEGDLNDNFYFIKNKQPKSIQYFSIKIYNRWGNKVYEYEDNDGSWQEMGKQGWDGKTRVGTQAKAGVYYYAILAKGWDGREFEVKGFVHIFY